MVFRTCQSIIFICASVDTPAGNTPLSPRSRQVLRVLRVVRSRSFRGFSGGNAESDVQKSSCGRVIVNIYAFRGEIRKLGAFAASVFGTERRTCTYADRSVVFLVFLSRCHSGHVRTFHALFTASHGGYYVSFLRHMRAITWRDSIASFPPAGESALVQLKIHFLYENSGGSCENWRGDAGRVGEFFESLLDGMPRILPELRSFEN